MAFLNLHILELASAQKALSEQTKKVFQSQNRPQRSFYLRPGTNLELFTYKCPNPQNHVDPVQKSRKT